MATGIKKIFSSEFLTQKRTLLIVWIILALASCPHPEDNNYLIFEGVFHHTIDQVSLYDTYPDEYEDMNHYGPFFSVVIAPFAILPVQAGKVLWQLCMTLLLFWAIYKLPLEQKKLAFICWFCAHELLTALFMQQFNIVIAAIIVLAFVFTEREKDIWATLFIVVGTFVKLYGIVGLAFFFFSKHKGKFILYFLLWSAVCFALPMLLSSPDYILGQYAEWYTSLVEKNGQNLHALHQNISFLGMVHKMSGNWFSDLYLIIPALALFALPYLRIRQYSNLGFRMAVMASAMMFTVLFSTGSESSTYIIAVVGVCVWYWSAPWKRSKWDIALMVLAFILTVMSPSDLIPKVLKDMYIKPYALKALPVTLIWFKLIFEMLSRNYAADGITKAQQR